MKVLDIHVAPPDFHARESCLGKRYSYSLQEGSGCPFTARFRWSLGRRKLDVQRMTAAAELLTGEHDFSAFAFRRPSDPRTPVKQMRRIEVQRYPLPGNGEAGLVVIIAESDRFLQHMMRILSGTLVQVGLGKLSVADVATLLAARGRKELHAAGGPQVYRAPPHGLCLEQCFYPEDGPWWGKEKVAPKPPAIPQVLPKVQPSPRADGPRHEEGAEKDAKMEAERWGEEERCDREWAELANQEDLREDGREKERERAQRWRRRVAN